MHLINYYKLKKYKNYIKTIKKPIQKNNINYEYLNTIFWKRFEYVYNIKIKKIYKSLFKLKNKFFINTYTNKQIIIKNNWFNLSKNKKGLNFKIPYEKYNKNFKTIQLNNITVKSICEKNFQKNNINLIYFL